MINTKIIFISSTGTELGKTFITENLIRLCMRKNKKVYAIKPVISGVDTRYLEKSDSGLILQALNRKVNFNNIKKISPWLFKAAIAPSLAAKKENKSLSYKKLKKWMIEFLKNNDKNYEYIFIEGAGGLMVPIGEKKTFLNLVAELKIPIILVVGSYLGSISHTLSLVENIKQKNIKLINITINQGNSSNICLQQTKKLLKDNMADKIKIREIYKNERDLNKIYSDINCIKY